MDRPVVSGLDQELRDYLVGSFRLSRSEIAALLDRNETNTRNRYDPELGYLLSGGRYPMGLDGALCTVTYDQTGARRMMGYANRPCRINTYGDSFTECSQVSDGETYQERLAANLGEPLRNFGVEGYSVYQAFLRLHREETAVPAPYIIFNLYSDDHYRTLNPATYQMLWRNFKITHASTRPYVTINAARNGFIEHPNPCPTPDSLLNLCEPEWIWHRFKDDDRLKLMFAQDRARSASGGLGKYYPMVGEIAARRNLSPPIESKETLLSAIDAIDTADALFSTMRLIERIEQFAAGQGKRVLYVLTYSGAARLLPALKGQKRFDQSLVDFIRTRRLPYVDLLEAHQADYRDFKCSPEEYLGRYFMKQKGASLWRFGVGIFGHYNPKGYEFLAFAIKDRLVYLLDPKPPAFREAGKGADFKGFRAD